MIDNDFFDSIINLLSMISEDTHPPGYIINLELYKEWINSF